MNLKLLHALPKDRVKHGNGGVAREVNLSFDHRMGRTKFLNSYNKTMLLSRHDISNMRIKNSIQVSIEKIILAESPHVNMG